MNIRIFILISENILWLLIEVLWKKVINLFLSVIWNHYTSKRNRKWDICCIIGFFQLEITYCPNFPWIRLMKKRFPSPPCPPTIITAHYYLPNNNIVLCGIEYTDEGSHFLSLLGQQNTINFSFIFSNI